MRLIHLERGKKSKIPLSEFLRVFPIIQSSWSDEVCFLSSSKKHAEKSDDSMAQKSRPSKQIGFLSSEILTMLVHFLLTDSRKQRNSSNGAKNFKFLIYIIIIFMSEINKNYIRNVSPHYYFYHNYTWEKCSYKAFYQRVKKWIEPEVAILPTNKKWHIVIEKWRECYCCKKFLEWEFFDKCKNSKIGFTGICKNCNSKRKKEYRSSYRGKIMTKNYKIIYSRNEEKRKLTNETHKKYVEKNKEKIAQQRREWYQENKTRILRERKQKEKEKFLKWEFVMFQGKKCKILQDYIPRKWCLIWFNQMKIMIPKKYLKPAKTESYLIF